MVSTSFDNDRIAHHKAEQSSSAERSAKAKKHSSMGILAKQWDTQESYIIQLEEGETSSQKKNNSDERKVHGQMTPAQEVVQAIEADIDVDLAIEQPYFSSTPPLEPSRVQLTKEEEEKICAEWREIAPFFNEKIYHMTKEYFGRVIEEVQARGNVDLERQLHQASDLVGVKVASRDRLNRDEIMGESDLVDELVATAEIPEEEREEAEPEADAKSRWGMKNSGLSRNSVNSTEGLLTALLVEVIKAQQSGHEEDSLISYDGVQKRREENKQITKEYLERKDAYIDGVLRSTISGWVNAAFIGGGIATGLAIIGLAIALGPAAIPPILAILAGAHSIGSGITSIYKGVVDHENSANKGEMEHLGFGKELNHQAIRDYVKLIGKDVETINQNWDLLHKVFVNMYHASRYSTGG